MPSKRLERHPPIDPGDPPDRSEGWGERLKHWLAGALAWLFELLFEALAKVLAFGVKEFVEDMELDLIELYKPFVDEIMSDPDIPDSVRDLFAQATSGESQAGAGLLASIGTSAGMSAASSILAPVMRIINYAMDRLMNTARFDPAVAIAAYRRFPELKKKFTGDMDDLGWTAERMKGWIELSKPTLPEGNLIALYFRYPAMQGRIKEELTMRGWTDQRIEDMIEAHIPRPSVQDEILFAVRDIYDPDPVSRFGLGAEFPDAFREFAEKLGIPEEDQRRYWPAHWNLPSLSFGIEMLHRLRPGRSQNTFTQADLNQLIKALDFSPYWRPRLAEIGEAIFTRVDLRRMLQAGVIDRDEVYESYLDLGYAPWRAEALTEFAAKTGGSTEKDLTRSAITEGYKRGLMSRDEAKSELMFIGYDEVESEFWVAMRDWEIQKSESDELEKVFQTLYVSGEMSLPELYVELGGIGVPATRQETLIRLWEIKKKAKVKTTSKSELDEWYKADLIKVDELTQGLRKLGWDARRSELFVLRLDQEVAIMSAKEAERAQKEHERIEKAELTSDYQKEKSRLDLMIALVNLEIADLKLAINQSEDSEQIADYKTQIITDKIVIAQFRAEKADLRVDLTGGSEGT